MSQTITIQRSKGYSKLLDNVIENELEPIFSNNEVLWVAMGNELEISGTEKTQISTIVRKDIEDMLWEKLFKEFVPREDYRYTNTKYFLVMKANEWTNPYMARNVNFDPETDQPDSSINTRNMSMRVLCDEVIDVCRTIKEKSKDEDTPLFEDVFGEKHMKEFYRQRMTITENCRNAIDNKTKVPKNTELFLLECLAVIVGSTNQCAQVFMEQNLIRLKKQGKFFTLKQATKFQKGGKQSQLSILKPVTRDTAIYLDYSGVQCTCESWRVRLDSNKLLCYDCGKILPNCHISKCKHCQIPLYKERLVWIVKHKNECQNCEGENDLPQELIDYANS